ncbi:MAG: type II toxin-antitoxin system HicA family toxin [Verrucomicrobiae bacterium]|nr:type II toxin-antitoxin system HicA family toxin [Verrucomicrobiae bacterium]
MVRHLQANGCVLDREGSRHSIYINSKTGVKSAVPRHPEIKELTARTIFKQLGIPRP